MGQHITMATRVCQADEILVGDVDQEKVMMSVERGHYFGLEQVGSQIWEMMESPIQVSALVKVLMGRYDVNQETCERDVLAFLLELNEAGMLHVVG